MDSVFLAVFCGVLVGALATATYKLGKRNCENERFKANQKTAGEVRRLRDSLRDDAVRDKLHGRFKR